MRFPLFFLLLITVFGFGQNKELSFEDFDLHIYDAFLDVNDTTFIEFKLIVNRVEKTVSINNGDEIIRIKNIFLSHDSIGFYIPEYNAELKGSFTDKPSFFDIDGFWFKGRQLQPYMKFYAVNSWSIHFPLRYEKARMFKPNPNYDISGLWTVAFGAGTDDSYEAVGEFVQDGKNLNGTFRTTTGDYRYLNGYVSEDRLKLSAFDGAHAFTFEASIEDSLTINKGHFWSGRGYHNTWTASKNDSASLPHPDSLTVVKADSLNFEFEAKDKKGYKRRFEDLIIPGKVNVFQIMGTWCPNCRDESKWLNEMKSDLGTDNVVISALCYERSDDYNQEIVQINRYKRTLELDYEMYYAGRADKKQTSKDFPMLNEIISYPTLIIIDQKGVIRKVHTGFNGPATSMYESYTNDLYQFIEKLTLNDNEKTITLPTDSLDSNK